MTKARSTNGKIDIDFSLAIHNRTGKYYIGRDLLETAGLPIGKVHYWGLAADAPPAGLFGRVIGRLQLLHIKGQTVGGGLAWLPPRRPKRPLLHLDPFTVPSTVLRASDAILCHDIGPLTHPELFDPQVCRIYKPIYDRIADVGPHMVFVSQASRAAFAQLYPMAKPASVRVIYPALRPGIAKSTPAAIPSVRMPFLLTVGSLGDRKNQVRCISAFARSGLVEKGYQYVLCGAREPGAEAVIAAAQSTPGVVCLPYVTDAQLAWLYASTRGFVLASLLEGFGMPVAEAIACGRVPLVSRDSVLHEVAGDGAILVDPLDEADIAAGMQSLANMDDLERQDRAVLLRSSVSQFGLDRIRDDWRRAFADILAGENAW